MKTYLAGCATAALVMGLSVTPAAAQETGSVGLLMGSGSTVGLTIQVTDKVAIRPSVGFVRSKSDSGGLADGERTTTGWAPGVDVTFKMKSWDATHLYLSPQWTYTRATASDDGANETTTTGHDFAGMVGVLHNLGTRFAVYGEAGLGRSTSKATFLEGVVGGKMTSWSTRSAIGAILFF